MKRINLKYGLIFALVMCASLLCFAGCAKKSSETKTNNESVGNVKNSVTKALETKKKPETVAETEPEVELGTESAVESAAESGSLAESESTAESGSTAESEKVETEDLEEEEYIEPEAEYVKINNPGWEYFYAGKEPDVHTQITLNQTSKKSNDIVNFTDWCNEVGFEPPYDSYSPMDDIFIYKLYGDEKNGTNWSQYMLDVCDICTGFPMYTLDFSDFHMPDVIKEGDEFFVDENIHWVTFEDDILYVSIFHNTYAESAPHNGYIMALDMNDNFRVLWKTEPLTCNTDNFVVTDDAIICGYGFTKEDDFIYVLDKKTGIRTQSYKVKTGPDWFFVKDNELYVRCYDTDYVFNLINPADNQ